MNKPLKPSNFRIRSSSRRYSDSSVDLELETPEANTSTSSTPAKAEKAFAIKPDPITIAGTKINIAVQVFKAAHNFLRRFMRSAQELTARSKCCRTARGSVFRHRQQHAVR